MTFVVAHRCGVFENSLGAARRCVKLNVDMVEIDIRATKDKKIIVMHDPTLERTSTGKGLIKDFTYEELKKFRLKNGEKIPLLEEFIKIGKGNYLFNIEIKEPGFEEQLISMLKRHKIFSKTIISSFQYDIIKKVKDIDPKAKVAKITNSPHKILLPKNNICYSIHFGLNKLTKKSIKPASKRFKVLFWTVNDEKDMRFLLEKKVYGIITDFPELLIKVKKRAA